MNQEVTQEIETQNTAVPEEEVHEQTLEDLYKESGLDVAQPQTQAAPIQETIKPAVPDVNVPDPYDVEAHKAFIANLARNQTALNETLQSTQKQIAEREREALMAKVEEEINQASEFVAKESGIENPKLATFELSERARTDAKFKALWDGRNSSPQAKAAFTKALKVVSNEIGKKYEIKSDPQLVANKKALAASRQSSSTTTQDDNEGPNWGSATGSEFERQWNMLIRPQG